MSDDLKEMREAVISLAEAVNDFSRAMGHHVAPEQCESVLKNIRVSMRELSERMQKSNDAMHE